MNRAQRTIIWIGILVAVAMFLYPPVGTVETYGRSSPRGYAFQFDDMHGRVIDYWRLFIQFGVVAAIAFVLVKKREGIVEERPLNPKVKLGIGIASLVVVAGLGATFLTIYALQVQEKGRLSAESAKRAKEDAALREEEAKKEAAELASLKRPRDLGSFTFGKNVDVSCEVRYDAGFAEMKVTVETAPRLATLVGTNTWRLYAVFEDSQGFEIASSYFAIDDGITKWINGKECLQLNGRQALSADSYRRIATWAPDFR